VHVHIRQYTLRILWIRRTKYLTFFEALHYISVYICFDDFLWNYPTYIIHYTVMYVYTCTWDLKQDHSNNREYQQAAFSLSFALWRTWSFVNLGAFPFIVWFLSSLVKDLICNSIMIEWSILRSYLLSNYWFECLNERDVYTYWSNIVEGERAEQIP